MVRFKFIHIAYWHILTVFHFLTHNMCNVDEEIESDFDFENDIVDDEKSDEEEKSDMENDDYIVEDKFKIVRMRWKKLMTMWKIKLMIGKSRCTKRI